MASGLHAMRRLRMRPPVAGDGPRLERGPFDDVEPADKRTTPENFGYSPAEGTRRQRQWAQTLRAQSQPKYQLERLGPLQLNACSAAASCTAKNPKPQLPALDNLCGQHVGRPCSPPQPAPWRLLGGGPCTPHNLPIGFDGRTCHRSAPEMPDLKHPCDEHVRQAGRAPLCHKLTAATITQHGTIGRGWGASAQGRTISLCINTRARRASACPSSDNNFNKGVRPRALCCK